MLPSQLFRLLLVAAPLALCAACGSGGSITDVSGVVNVDGAPVDGTISFRPVQGNGPSAGGAINAGLFTASSRQPLRPGAYSVMIQASAKTGRTIQDPQRGPIEESRPLPLSDVPQQIELTIDSVRNLVLHFSTGRQ